MISPIHSPRLQPVEPVVNISNMTFGYNNELLLAHGIDPEILHELPAELRAELLSTIDVAMISQ